LVTVGFRLLAVLSFKITSWYFNQRVIWAGDIQKSRVSLFSWSSWNLTNHPGSFDLCSINVFNKRDASCTISDLTLYFCIALARSQSRIDRVRNLAFNNLHWMVIDKFSYLVRNWISLRASSGMQRYIDEYFSVLVRYNVWLYKLLKVVRVMIWEFWGQLKFAFHGQFWRFDLRSRWLLISTCFCGW
jgi:hypothetical protein